MKKRVLALTMALTMAFLTACSGGGGQSGTAADTGGGESGGASAETGGNSAVDAEITEPVTIKFANYAVLEAGYDVYWNGLLEKFHEENPNITVELVTAPYGEIVNTIINMAGGGDKVDVIFGENDWIPTLVDAGLAAPVENVLSQELVADIYSNILEACSMDGVAYGVPMYISPFLMYYNKDLFEQAGLDPNSPPTTYDEMLEIAPKLAALTTEDGNQVYPFGLTTASVAVSGACLTSSVYNFGGTVLDEEGNLAIDQGFRDAVEMWKTLDDNGYNPQNSKLKDLRNLFALGQLAMYYDQSWGYNGISSINPDAESFIASAAPLKGGDGTGESVLQAGTLMVVDNGDAQKAAVAKLVDFIMSEEMLTEYFETVSPAYPARQSMADLEVIADSPILAGAADSVSNLKTVTFVPALSDLNLELCTLAQAVTVSGTDVDTAIADFETAARGILE